MRGRLVDVLDALGDRLYRGLVDDGGPVLPFRSGSGFLDRLDLGRHGWTLVDHDPRPCGPPRPQPWHKPEPPAPGPSGPYGDGEDYRGGWPYDG